jgi:hypothetical protein
MSNRFSEFRLILIFGMGEWRSRACTLGVWERTLPAFVNDP